MSWYQALDGASVSLSESARERVGVDGFGVDDSGVVDNVDAVVNVLRVGQELGCLTEGQLKRLFKMKDGSEAQTSKASSLCSKALGGLEKSIEKSLAMALSRCTAQQPNGIQEYVKWARGCGWEFPVGWGEESGRSKPQLLMGDTYGLCVMEVNTDGLSWEKQTVVLALIDLLCIEGYKTTILDQLMNRMDMYGLYEDPTQAVRGGVILEDDELLEWIKKYDSEALENLAGDFEGHEEHLLFWVRLFYDTLTVKQRLAQARTALLGESESTLEDRTKETLEAIGREVDGWQACELKQFVQWCVNELAGETTAALFEKLDQDEEFNGMPGLYAVVVTGFDIAAIGDVLSEINEYANNGDDDATVGLSGGPQDIAAFLSRITLAERMLLMLASMSENGSLSAFEQAG